MQCRIVFLGVGAVQGGVLGLEAAAECIRVQNWRGAAGLELG